MTSDINRDWVTGVTCSEKLKAIWRNLTDVTYSVSTFNIRGNYKKQKNMQNPA